MSLFQNRILRVNTHQQCIIERLKTELAVANEETLKARISMDNLSLNAKSQEDNEKRNCWQKPKEPRHVSVPKYLAISNHALSFHPVITVAIIMSTRLHFCKSNAPHSFTVFRVFRLLVRFYIISGSNPPSAKLHLERGEWQTLYYSSCRNHEIWSNQEETRGHFSIRRKLLSVQMFTFDI